MTTELTKSQGALVEKVNCEGKAWIVPAQLRMARTLHSRRFITLTRERRWNREKRITEHMVVPFNAPTKGAP